MQQNASSNISSFTAHNYKNCDTPKTARRKTRL